MRTKLLGKSKFYQFPFRLDSARTSNDSEKAREKLEQEATEKEKRLAEFVRK